MLRRIPYLVLILGAMAMPACLPLDESGAHQGATYQAYTWVGEEILALRTAFTYDDECGVRFGEHREVVLISLDGSESLLFIASEEAAAGRTIDASGDGSRIVIREGKYFRLLDSLGQEIRRFDTSAFSAVRISDDGRHAALVARGDGAGASRLQRVDLPGGEPTEVTANGLHPAFSPNGIMLAYWKDVVGGMYVSDLDGSDEFLVTRGGASGEADYPQAPFVWAADNDTIFYREDGALFRVRVRPEGENSRVWTFLNEPSRAEVSPDGGEVLIDDDFGGFRVLDLEHGNELLHRGDYLCG